MCHREIYNDLFTGRDLRLPQTFGEYRLQSNDEPASDHITSDAQLYRGNASGPPGNEILMCCTNHSAALSISGSKISRFFSVT